MNQAPWDDWAERVVIHTPMYLSHDGDPSTGGRERHVRDFARLIRDEWKRPVVIAQMANRDFETTCQDGFSIVGRKAYTKDSRGEPGFAFWLKYRFARSTDAVLYPGADHAFPFFRPGSKGIQHGIWWDGPLSLPKRLFQPMRMTRFVESMRSVMCVDTNLINWLRVRGPRGLDLARRCYYLPNYADTDRIPTGDPDRGPGRPLRLLYARRFAAPRGPFLFLDTLAELSRRGVAFEAAMFTVGGEADLKRGVLERGLAGKVEVATESLDGILGRYAEADVSVVPTLWSEGTSFAAVESICAGIPVVSTPVGGLANLIVPGYNGQIAAPTPEALADGIQTLTDEPTWRRMRANCLSMRDSLGMPRWREAALRWIKA